VENVERATNLANRLKEAKGTEKESEWLEEAVLFAYDELGYSSGDDVRMLLCFAAYREIDEVVTLLLPDPNED